MSYSGLVLGTFVVSLVWILTGVKRGEGTLPPGPKGLPIIGVNFIMIYLTVSLLLILKSYLECR